MVFYKYYALPRFLFAINCFAVSNNENIIIEFKKFTQLKNAQDYTCPFML